MTEPDAIWDHRDGQQARRLAEVLGLDGWLVEWARIGEVDWEARLSGPSFPGRVVGRGRSRVSAISRAHVEAIRRLRLGDVPANQTQSLDEKRWAEGPVPVLDSPRPSQTPSHGPDLGAGIVSVVPIRAEPAPSP